MKNKLWLYLGFSLLVITMVWFVARSYTKKGSLKSQEKESTLMYNQESQEWEIVDDLLKISIEDIDPNPNNDGLHNRTILRGYFNHYDDTQDKLVIKAVLPFTGNLQYQLVELELKHNSLYCSPSIIVDKKTGQQHLTKDLEFIVKNGQVMKISQEKMIGFDEFITKAKQDTYVFIQLTEDFAKTKKNIINKLVVIGLCD